MLDPEERPSGIIVVVSEKSYTVQVVVDAFFGARLAEISAEGPVWIVDSPINRPAVERLWAERAEQSHLTGITIFNPNGEGAEALLLSELDTIDLHHGEYSASPPYAVVVVHGLGPTPSVTEAFAALGFQNILPTVGGFVAKRKDAAQ